MAPLIWNIVLVRPGRSAAIATSIATPLQISEDDYNIPKFPMFPKLCTELRLKIWSYALPDRQIITIRGDSLTPFHEDTFVLRIPLIPGYSGPRYEVSQEILSPALLFVNAEAREFALKSYVPIFTKVKTKIGKHVAVYMDFDRDILYLDSCHPSWADYLDGIQFDLNRVKNLALGRDIEPWLKPFNNKREIERENDTRFKHFLNLQTLVMHSAGDTPFRYEFDDDDEVSKMFKNNMESIWKNPMTGTRLTGVNGEVIYPPSFMCRLPKKDLVSFNKADCRRRWRDVRIKDAEDKAAELKAAFDAALSAAAALQV
ncbi:hypothetical protein DL98DRAFT_531568 [Cadophora sp. DSE1049]|nr:hypothetical protein DL98DRAFT_531568 [Cadophora sp. DSE1049]